MILGQYMEISPKQPTLQKRVWSGDWRGCSKRGKKKTTTTFLLGMFILTFGEGHGNPLHYSYLEDPMDRGAWRTAVHGITKNWARLKRLSMHVHFLTLAECRGIMYVIIFSRAQSFKHIPLALCVFCTGRYVGATSRVTPECFPVVYPEG